MKIAFFGDSICVGQGVSIHKTWVTCISQQLHEIANKHQTDILIANSSVNGRITRQALESMPFEIQSHNYDIVIIQFGMNDCNHWQTDKGLPRVSKKAFEANLNEIIDRAQQFGAKNIFLNTNHPTPRINKMPYTSISYQQSNEEYNRIIRDIGNIRTDVVLNDIEKYAQDYISKNNITVSDIVLDDQLHLSDLGHKLYFEYIYPKLESCILNHIIKS